MKVTGVTEKNVALKWSEPEHDGGSEITGYVIEQKDASKRSWQRIGEVEATEKKLFNAIGLQEGQQYNFRIAAENSVGVGEFAEMFQSVLAKCQYGLFRYV